MYFTKFFAGFLSTVLLFMFALQASSAGLAGIVIDTITTQPVEKARVQLNGEYFCFTDDSGRFAFPQLPSGDWTISVSRMGYRTKSGIQATVAEQNQPCVFLQLAPSAIILPGQRVTGTRLDYDLFGLPAFVRSGDELLAEGLRDIPQALASIPGIIVNPGFSTSGTPCVTVRGETGKRLEFSLDGLSLAEGVRGEFDLSAIPLSAVENIVVRPGGQWGDAALGGSVNINTRKEFSSARRVAFAYGSFNERNISATVSGMPGSNYGYLITGEMADRNRAYSYVDSMGEDVARPNSEFHIRKVYGKLGGRLAPDWDWGVSGLVHENNRGVPGTVQYSTPAAEVKERRRIVAGSLSGLVSDRLSVLVRTSLSDFRTRYRDTLSYATHTQYDETSYLLDAAVLFSPYEHSPITASAGGEMQYRRLAGRDFIASQPAFDQASRTAEAVWIQAQLRSPADVPVWIGNGHITGGLRYDTDDQTSSHTAPRVTAAWGWGAPRLVNLAASWGRSFSRPLLTSLYWEDAYSRGNPDLQPEKAREWDIKIEVMPPRTDLALSTRFFDRRYDGFIEWVAGTDWIWSPVNLPRATLVGREDGLSWNALGGRFSFEFFHTLLWATDEAPGVYQGKFLPERPKHSYQANTRFHYHGFDMHVAARWEDERYTNKENTKWSPPYRWFDLMIRRAIPWEMFDPVLTAACENLTNEAAALRDGYPLPSRTFKVGMELHF